MPDLIYGRHPVAEALRAGWKIRKVLVARGASFPPDIRRALDEATQRGVPIVSLPRQQLDAMVDHHQGIVAEVQPFPYADLAAVIDQFPALPRPPLVLLLDALQDPQNLGSLIRTAAAVGANAVVIPARRAVAVTPAVIKASAGTALRVPIARVTNLASVADGLKRAGLWLVGLDAGAPQPYYEVDMSGATGIVVGSEAAGIHRVLRERCDFLVRLPMEPEVESLNAAVAGSVVLYEAYRQRLARETPPRARPAASDQPYPSPMGTGLP